MLNEEYTRRTALTISTTLSLMIDCILAAHHGVLAEAGEREGAYSSRYRAGETHSYKKDILSHRYHEFSNTT